MAKAKRIAEVQEEEQTETITETKTEIPNFDYRDLTGERFDKYNEFLSSLGADKHYDFILLKVMPVFKERYPGMRESVKDFVGIRAKTDIPEHTTRILLSQAINYNDQIFNAASLANGKFYLLKPKSKY